MGSLVEGEATVPMRMRLPLLSAVMERGVMVAV